MNIIEHTCNAFISSVMLTVSIVVFSIKTCSLYDTCVTLFYTHLQQGDINPTYTSKVIKWNSQVKRTNPEQLN